jgi:hypothetical protein
MRRRLASVQNVVNTVCIQNKDTKILNNHIVKTQLRLAMI